MDGIPHLVNIEHFVQIIREMSLFRQMIDSTNRTMAECLEQAEPAEEVLDRAEQALFALSKKGIQSGLVPVKDLKAEAQRLLDQFENGGEIVTGVATGLDDFDRMTSGLQPGELIILAGRPSMGTTALALNIAQHIALRKGEPVGIFSLETSRTQLLMRMLSAEAMVDSHRVRIGWLSESDYPKLIDSLDQIASAPIFIDDSSSPTIMHVRAQARRLKAEHGLGLVIVDPIQSMSGFGRWENRTQETAAISRGLKALAKELNVPVIALSQVEWTTEQFRDHRPRLSDLSEFGSIAHDADLVAFIYREEVYLPNEENAGMAEVIIAKQRNGPTGVIKLEFQKQYTRFQNPPDIQ